MLSDARWAFFSSRREAEKPRWEICSKTIYFLIPNGEHEADGVSGKRAEWAEGRKKGKKKEKHKLQEINIYHLEISLWLFLHAAVCNRVWTVLRWNSWNLHVFKENKNNAISLLKRERGKSVSKAVQKDQEKGPNQKKKPLCTVCCAYPVAALGNNLVFFHKIYSTAAW